MNSVTGVGLAAAALVLGVSVFSASRGAQRGSGVFEASSWQRMASPGSLSKAHAFLDSTCAACHTAVAGADPLECILCHANDESLLQRQPTAFHANVGQCRQCHREHAGRAARLSRMDHAALARLGLRQLSGADDPDDEGRLVAGGLKRWMERVPARVVPSGRPLAPEEMTLRCSTCHQNDDRHFGLFGNDCVQCHHTSAWNIAGFRHPPPTSMDCAQCHQAPPSHYMEHFRMISQRIAGREHARVDQCFLCHRTTAWPDIRRVGWYKHH